MRKVLWLFIAGAAAVTVIMTYLFATGPRMYVQPNIRPFDAEMPVPPSNSVTVTDAWTPAPSAAEAPSLVNPVADTDEARRRGRVYYEYYCLACHGTAGDGAGPVGESYVPAPADLRTAVPQIPTDGELLRRMLTGTGHTPVLERAVQPEHRWPLVRYVRALAVPPAATAAAPHGTPPVER